MVELSSEMIVFEILTRVPPKVVGRSKSVCKAWYALLSGHTFVREHFSRSSISSNQKVLLIDDQTCLIQPINFETHNYDPGTIVPIPFDHRSYDNFFNDVSIVSHLNGLLCVCHNLTSDLFLWNPLTTAFKRLSPPYSTRFYRDYLDAVSMYTDTHDDFKVLHIRRRDGALGGSGKLRICLRKMAKNIFLSDGSLRSGDVYSTVAQIPSIVDTGKEPIQAPSQSVQSTTRKEPIQSQSNLMSIRLKRVKKSKYVTLSVDEKGRDVLTCNHCQNVIKKVSPEVCFTIPEEEEVEIPSQNVKARTVKGEGSCREAIQNLRKMAKNMFSSDGSLQSGDVFSTFAQIPSIVDTGKEPIQARSQLVQSTAPKEPIQSQSNLMPRRLKRVKAFKYITLSVDEKGRDIITCNHCQNVIHVGREKASCKKVPEVCFTIPEEEEVETSRNVKARTVKVCHFMEYPDQMTSEDWAEYDAYLLKRLGDVVKRGDLSMGTRYTERFYEEFAPKLAAVTGQEITAQDVIDRVHRLREIYHDCKADGVFHHDVMKSDEFCYRMKRCFGLTYGKKPRIPRSRLSSLHTWNVGSGSGAGSGSGSGSVSSASVSNEPTSLEKALARLHTRNRARLDGHRCLLFTRLLERDPQVSKLFLALKTPEEKLNFIDDQKLERFDFQRAAAVGDGGLACGGRGTGLHCLPVYVF
ncbi:F-box domain containing protein [Tanacetum coccineum]